MGWLGGPQPSLRPLRQPTRRPDARGPGLVPHRRRSGATRDPDRRPPRGRAGVDRGQPGRAAGARRASTSRAAGRPVGRLGAGRPAAVLRLARRPRRAAGRRRAPRSARSWPRRPTRGASTCAGWSGARTSDRLQFSAGGEPPPRRGDRARPAARCLLDMRVRHRRLAPPEARRAPPPRTAPERDVAFVGGIDLCHGRRDDARHRGDPQALPMAAVLRRRTRPGTTSSWRCAGRPSATSSRSSGSGGRTRPRSTPQPVRARAASGCATRTGTPSPLPPQLPDPGPAAGTTPSSCCGPTRPAAARLPVRAATVSAASPAATRKALRRARRLVYLEDQYLWSERGRPSASPTRCARARAAAGRRRPAATPTRTGGSTLPAEPARPAAPPSTRLRAAGGDRVAVYGLENDARHARSTCTPRCA